MKVGFIGLGAMGRGMASRLMDAGNEVHVWNRSPAPCEELARHGAHRADSPAAVFISDAVITMLADDDAVRATIFDGDVFRNAKKKPVHIVMTPYRSLLHANWSGRTLTLGLPMWLPPSWGAPMSPLPVSSTSSPPAILRRSSECGRSSMSWVKRPGAWAKNRIRQTSPSLQ